MFNVLVGNRDDHLRNHGFLREPTGWRLSPAYDVNPNVHKLEHALTLDGSSAAPNLDVVLATAGLYRLGDAAAKRLVEEVRGVVATWREEAVRLGLSRAEQTRMAAAFRP